MSENTASISKERARGIVRVKVGLGLYTVRMTNTGFWVRRWKTRTEYHVPLSKVVDLAQKQLQLFPGDER